MSHSRKSDTAVKQSCGSDPSRARRQIGQNRSKTREFCPKEVEKQDFIKEEEPCPAVNWAKSLRNKRVLPKRRRKTNSQSQLPANPQNSNELIARHKQNQRDAHLFHK